MAQQRQSTIEDLILTRGLDAVIRNANPWWAGVDRLDVPPFRRWPFDAVLHGLKKGLAPSVVLRGPRQVGKTTLLNQVIDHLLSEGVDPALIFRLQFDDLPDLRRLTMPIIELCDWYAASVLGKSFHEAARSGRQPFIFLDEVENLADWAPQLKSVVDLNPVRVMVTGSSALRIEAGRDSLAGRMSTIEMGPLLLREIAKVRGFGLVEPLLPPNGLSPLKDRSFWAELRSTGERDARLRQREFEAFSARGAYPIAQLRTDEPWERVADFLNETVIARAIQHDLRMGPHGQKRDEHLLAEVFRLACRYVGQAPDQKLYLEELRQTMHAGPGWQRILSYLKFLDGTLLLRLIEPPELRLKKKRGPAKLCLCDHALRAAWLQEVIPIAPADLARSPHLADMAGRIADGAAGYFFRSIIGLDVSHYPQRGAEPEVDYVLTVGEQRIPVEVKYRREIDPADTRGLRSFIEKAHHHAPFGVLVTLRDEPGSDDPRIVSLPLSTLLLMR
ncbi:MAG: ATP-binding protein [Phycisphaerales bacterium]|nr:MAG: ATP-binding protein [Phycisphaerales bacterium]